jgi:hypothetical protein
MTEDALSTSRIVYDFLRERPPVLAQCAKIMNDWFKAPEIRRKDLADLVLEQMTSVTEAERAALDRMRGRGRIDWDELGRLIAAGEKPAKTTDGGREPLPSPAQAPDRYECEACSAQPGSPTLCRRCVRARKIAGRSWIGPRSLYLPEEGEAPGFGHLPQEYVPCARQCGGYLPAGFARVQPVCNSCLLCDEIRDAAKRGDPNLVRTKVACGPFTVETRGFAVYLAITPETLPAFNAEDPKRLSPGYCLTHRGAEMLVEALSNAVLHVRELVRCAPLPGEAAPADDAEPRRADRNP